MNKNTLTQQGDHILVRFEGEVTEVLQSVVSFADCSVPLSIPPRVAHLSSLTLDSRKFNEVADKILGRYTHNHLSNYASARITKKLAPLSFVIDGIETISNPLLKARFQDRCAELGCSKREWGFHGNSNEIALRDIVDLGLLPRLHHLVRTVSVGTDNGWFDSCTTGVYVSKTLDYSLKYSNNMNPLELGDTVTVLVLDVCPWKQFVAPEYMGTVSEVEPGFDSHCSQRDHQFWLPKHDQCLPLYLIKVRAVQKAEPVRDDR